MANGVDKVGNMCAAECRSSSINFELKLEMVVKIHIWDILF